VGPIRIAVVGAGAFGRNHLRVYRELEMAHPELVQLTGLVDESATTREEAAVRYGIPAFSSVAELLAAGLRLDAASVCVPTVHHAAVAEQLLNAGLDVLIEKPFAASLAEADHVLALAGSLGRIVQIGHLERFNPAVSAVAERLNNPMFFEAHRLSIFTPRSLDVDVVLDLMIHDLDVVLSLTNSPVREVRAVGLAVLSRKVDIANVRVEFDSGCVANFTASRVSTEQVRKVRLFQPHQYLSLDFARQELLSIDVDPAAATAFLSRSSPPPPAAAASSGAGLQHPSAGLNLQKFDLARAEPLRLELEDFLRAVRTRTPPRVTGEAGRAALSLALEINREIGEHAQRAGLA
jgi:predicted dehydrogenase